MRNLKLFPWIGIILVSTVWLACHAYPDSRTYSGNYHLVEKRGINSVEVEKDGPVLELVHRLQYEAEEQPIQNAERPAKRQVSIPVRNLENLETRTNRDASSIDFDSDEEVNNSNVDMKLLDDLPETLEQTIEEDKQNAEIEPSSDGTNNVTEWLTNISSALYSSAFWNGIAQSLQLAQTAVPEGLRSFLGLPPIDLLQIGENGERREREAPCSEGTSQSTAVNQIVQQFMPATATPAQQDEMRQCITEASTEIQNLFSQFRTACGNIRDSFSIGVPQSCPHSPPCQDPGLLQNAPALIKNIMENPDQISQLPEILQYSVPSSQMSSSVDKLKCSFQKIFDLLQKINDEADDGEEDDEGGKKSKFGKSGRKSKKSRKNKKNNDQNESKTNRNPNTVILTIPTPVPVTPAASTSKCDSSNRKPSTVIVLPGAQSSPPSSDSAYSGYSNPSNYQNSNYPTNADYINYPPSTHSYPSVQTSSNPLANHGYSNYPNNPEYSSYNNHYSSNSDYPNYSGYPSYPSYSENPSYALSVGSSAPIRTETSSPTIYTDYSSMYGTSTNSAASSSATMPATSPSTSSTLYTPVSSITSQVIHPEQHRSTSLTTSYATSAVAPSYVTTNVQSPYSHHHYSSQKNDKYYTAPVTSQPCSIVPEPAPPPCEHKVETYIPPPPPPPTPCPLSKSWSVPVPIPQYTPPAVTPCQSSYAPATPQQSSNEKSQEVSKGKSKFGKLLSPRHITPSALGSPTTPCSENNSGTGIQLLQINVPSPSQATVTTPLLSINSGGQNILQIPSQQVTLLNENSSYLSSIQPGSSAESASNTEGNIGLSNTALQSDCVNAPSSNSQLNTASFGAFSNGHLQGAYPNPSMQNGYPNLQGYPGNLMPSGSLDGSSEGNNLFLSSTNGYSPQRYPNSPLTGTPNGASPVDHLTIVQQSEPSPQGSYINLPSGTSSIAVNPYTDTSLQSGFPNGFSTNGFPNNPSHDRYSNSPLENGYPNSLSQGGYINTPLQGAYANVPSQVNGNISPSTAYPNPTLPGGYSYNPVQGGYAQTSPQDTYLNSQSTHPSTHSQSNPSQSSSSQEYPNSAIQNEAPNRSPQSYYPNNSFQKDYLNAPSQNVGSSTSSEDSYLNLPSQGSYPPGSSQPTGSSNNFYQAGYPNSPSVGQPHVSSQGNYFNTAPLDKNTDTSSHFDYPNSLPQYVTYPYGPSQSGNANLQSVYPSSTSQQGYPGSPAQNGYTNGYPVTQSPNGNSITTQSQPQNSPLNNLGSAPTPLDVLSDFSSLLSSSNSDSPLDKFGSTASAVIDAFSGASSLLSPDSFEDESRLEQFGNAASLALDLVSGGSSPNTPDLPNVGNAINGISSLITPESSYSNVPSGSGYPQSPLPNTYNYANPQSNYANVPAGIQNGHSNTLNNPTLNNLGNPSTNSNKSPLTLGSSASVILDAISGALPLNSVDTSGDENPLDQLGNTISAVVDAISSSSLGNSGTSNNESPLDQLGNAIVNSIINASSGTGESGSQTQPCNERRNPVDIVDAASTIADSVVAAASLLQARLQQSQQNSKNQPKNEQLISGYIQTNGNSPNNEQPLISGFIQTNGNSPNNEQPLISGYIQTNGNSPKNEYQIINLPSIDIQSTGGALNSLPSTQTDASAPCNLPTSPSTNTADSAVTSIADSVSSMISSAATVANTFSSAISQIAAQNQKKIESSIILPDTPASYINTPAVTLPNPPTAYITSSNVAPAVNSNSLLTSPNLIIYRPSPTSTPENQISLTLPRDKIFAALNGGSALPGDMITITLNPQAALVGKVPDFASPISFKLIRQNNLEAAASKKQNMWNISSSQCRDNELQSVLQQISKNLLH